MRKGLTLIEIVVTITLLAIIAGVYLLTANPAAQLAGSRNSTRFFHLQTIMNGIRQNIADQTTEQFLCSSGPIPTTTTRMASTPGSYNIAPCLVPTYLLTLPLDPGAAGVHYNSDTDYDTGYFISINTTTSQVTLSAPSAELGKTVSITR